MFCIATLNFRISFIIVIEKKKKDACMTGKTDLVRNAEKKKRLSKGKPFLFS